MEYSEKVMDHFMNPRNVGEIADASGIGQVGNAKCGDIMKVYLKIEDGIVQDAKFKTFGCGAAVATSSMATELVKALWRLWTVCRLQRYTVPVWRRRPCTPRSGITQRKTIL